MSEKSNVIPDVIKLSKVANVKEMKQELMSKDKTNRLRNYLSDKEVKEYCFNNTAFFLKRKRIGYIF